MELGETYTRRGNSEDITNNVDVGIEWLSGQAILDTKLPLPATGGTYAVVRRKGAAIAAVRLRLNKYDVENRSETIDKVWAIDAMDLLNIDH